MGQEKQLSDCCWAYSKGAVAERFRVCTSKSVPLLIISAKKPKFSLYDGKTALLPPEVCIGKQDEEIHLEPDWP